MNKRLNWLLGLCIALQLLYAAYGLGYSRGQLDEVRLIDHALRVAAGRAI